MFAKQFLIFLIFSKYVKTKILIASCVIYGSQISDLVFARFTIRLRQDLQKKKNNIVNR